MRVAWLELTAVRSYDTLRFEPVEGVNVLVGPNGAGKTTVLEAISYATSLRSFRRAPDAALVSDGAPGAVLRAGFVVSGRELVVEIEIPANGRRRSLLNAKRTTRGELLDLLPAVAFLPDDLDLVKRGPSYRREFLDELAAGLWPVAAAEQRDFDRALTQRNALLRREGRRADRPTLDVWDERLSVLAAAVALRRIEVLERIEPAMRSLLSDLGEGDRLESAYVAAALGTLSRSPSPEDYATAISAAREADLDRRTTTVGPHRDEVVWSLDGRDVRQRASQGEQRSVSLALRVASYEALAERHGTPPILLLDDVFSELDPGRSDRLVERLPTGQVFVSSARRDEVPYGGTVWHVSGNDLVREEAA